MLVRRLSLAAVVSVCCVVGGLVFGGGSALALRTHLLVSSFRGSGASALSEPAGIAVNDETGDVYVVDQGNNRVEELDATGATVLGEFNGATAGHALSTASGRLAGIAVDNSANQLDPSKGDVYVMDTGHNVIAKFSASGTYLGQIAQTTGGAVLGELDGVAVDPNGAVWVYQASGEIDHFSDALANEYVSQISSPFGGTETGFAVDAEENLYVVGGSSRIGKINSSGEVLIDEMDGEGSFGAAVNLSSHEVFVDNITSIGVFSSSDSSLERFGAGQLGEARGVAVNSTNDRAYVADHANGVVDVFSEALLADVSTAAATNVVPTSVTLNGTVNPAGVPVTSCVFEYGTDTSYGQSVPCTQSPGSGTSPVAVSANVTRLKEGTTYHFRLVATNADGVNQGLDEGVTTLPSPVIDGASSTNVAADSVDLNARIDPGGYDTTYRFEYGTSTSYGTSAPIPDADIGSGTSDVTATLHVTSLQANTTYHWRVVAHNDNGTTTGSDHTFIYDTDGAGSLPDGRAYEMVTPSAKDAALIGDVFIGLRPSIAEDGSSVILPSIQCFGDATSCTAAESRVGSPFAFTRTGGGWEAAALAPPATSFDRNSGLGVNADTGSALFTMPTPPVGEWDWYARRSDGAFVDIGPLRPPSSGSQQNFSNIPFYAGTADLSHLAYESPPVWPFDETANLERYNSLYEYVGVGNAAPVLVGVSGGAGSNDLISKCGTRLGSGNAGDGPYGALSDDGRTVFFVAEPCASGSGVNAGVAVPTEELYARVDRSQTVPISQHSPLECTGGTGCLGSPPGAAHFVGASADGSRAFFFDTRRLTDGASEDGNGNDSAYSVSGCSNAVGANGCNLYEYDFGNPTGRNLVAVSAGDSSGGGPRVQGVLAFSKDGSHVYFVARGVLTGAANDQGQTARNGAENLYAFERDASHPAGRVSFVAGLSEADNFAWTQGYFSANVTPDGRFLVFTSHGALTRDDSSSSGAAQVFRYDAQTGQLLRLSIGENGFNDNGNAGVGGARVVPDLTASGPLGFPRTDPTMSHDGAYVFFESPVALTPGALDDVPIGSETSGAPAYADNVYEWHEGHVYLLSDGRDVGATLSAPCAEHLSSVCLLGADATGRNVFFTTADPLVPADTDTEMDVYDARVCTSGEPCIAPAAPPAPPCQGEACHGTPGGAPGAVNAATTTFSGPGNILPDAVAVAPKAKRHKSAKPKAKKRKAMAKRPRASKHGSKRRAKSSKQGHGHSSRAEGR